MIFQVTLKGEKADPEYKNICCKSCWFAKLDKCTCRCEGKFHGKGRRKVEPDVASVERPRKHKGTLPYHIFPPFGVSVCENQPKETSQ